LAAVSGGAIQLSIAAPAKALSRFSAPRALRGVWQAPQWLTPSAR
jgi:hypothetical protein